MALTANASLTKRNAVGAIKHTLTVKTSAVIYQDALCVQDISANTCLPAADTGTTLFAGIALESSTGTFPVTGDGTITVDVYRLLEVQVTAKTVVTKGKIFAAAYAFDDASTTFYTTKGPEIGFFSDWVTVNTEVWVFLGLKALSKAAN